jgi:signal transduction histidine kinase
MRAWIAFGSAAVVAFACGVAGLLAPGAATLLMDVAWTLAAAAAAIATSAVARRLPDERRRPWRLLAAGAWSWLLAQVVWDVASVLGTPGFPGTADAFYLLAALCGIAALFRLGRVGGRVNRVHELDATAVMIGIAALAVAWLYVPVSESALGLAAKGTALAYVFLYGALLVIWVDVLAGLPDLRGHRGLLVALAGVTVSTFAWIDYAYDVLDARYSAGHAFGLFWVAGQLALGAGALLAERDREPALADPLDRLRRRMVMPAAGFVALIASLMLFAVLDRPVGSRIVMEVGLLLLGGVFVLRNRLATDAIARIQGQARRLLEERNLELEVFAQAASHDLKAPLVSIQGLSHALERSIGDRLDAKGRLYVERIQANANAMQSLIDGLLEFARVGVDESAEPIDADAIARAAVAEASERAGRTAIELVTPVPPVLAHPVRFKQALANLIENGERYGGTSVRVSAAAVGDTVEIAVEDDGPGIPPAERDRVFELFSRGRAGIDRAPTGSGFGLALVRKIANSSGGSVRYEDGASTGARFVLTFRKGVA